MSAGLASRYAPSWSLIRAHFGLGVIGLVAFAAGLLVRAAEPQGSYFTPTLLGLTHLCVLGWLLPVAIGALHQLVPVVFEVPVRSERVAWSALALYLPGATLLIVQLWTFRIDAIWLPLGAVTAALAVALYIGNLIATLAASKVHSLSGMFVIAALGYLLLAVAVGAMLAWNLYDPFLATSHLQVLKAHAHLAGFGFFGLLVMGVGLRLLEMFLLSSGASEQPGVAAFFACNLAVLCLTASLLLGSQRWLLGLGVGAAALGVGAFLLQVRGIWARRMQRRADIGWLHTRTSFVYLGLAVVTGALTAFAPLDEVWLGRMALLYGLLALPGFLGSVVVGQLYKIVPFLVWLHRFSPLVGLKKVPSAGELLGERPRQVQYLFNHTAVIVLAGGVLIDSPAVRIVGATLFAVSAALVARNLWLIDSRRP